MKIIPIMIFIPMLLSCALIKPRIENIEDFLPRDTDVPGWTVISVKKKSGEDIGKDNVYSGTGADEIITAGYVYVNSRDKALSVTIIRFNTSLDAYGFISTRRGFLPCTSFSCENSFLSDSISLKRMGNYVIFAESADKGLFLKQELLSFTKISQSYMKNIAINDQLPEDLNILKESDDNIIIYSRKNFDKIPMLSGVIYTRWGKEDSSPIVFVSKRRSVLDSFNLFKKIVENEKYIIVNADDIHTAFKKDGVDRYIFLTVHQQWIAGCVSTGGLDVSENNLKKVRDKLSSLKRNAD